MAEPVPYKKSKLGIDGIDAVVYVRNLQKVDGKAEFKTKHEGITYCFSSKENLELFVRNTKQYLPQFEGSCAFTYGLFGGLVAGWRAHIGA